MTTEIDLERPEKLLASADNAKDYTFYLALPKPEYTPAAFEANPNCVAAGDLLFRSPLVQDENGRAFVDLAPKAKEIKDKLKDERTAVKAVLLGHEKTMGRKKAVVEDYTLKKNVSAIELKPIRTTCSPQHWVAYHHPIFFIDLLTKGGIKDVHCQWTIPGGMTPMFAVWEQGAPGTNEVKKLVVGAAGEPHAPSANCTLPAQHHEPGWWGRVPASWWQGVVDFSVTPEVHYVIAMYPRGPGNFVLTVSGTGAYAGISQKIELTLNGAHPHPGD